MPASKVSFRIDYYRTSDKSPLKGIIEHLPSRQNKSFEGEGQLVINHFMNRYLTEENGKGNKKKSSVADNESAPVTKNGEHKKTQAAQETASQQTETFTINTGSELIERLRAEFAAAQRRKTVTKPPVQQKEQPTEGTPAQTLAEMLSTQVVQRRSQRMKRLNGKSSVQKEQSTQGSQPQTLTEMLSTQVAQRRSQHRMKRLSNPFIQEKQPTQESQPQTLAEMLATQASRRS